MRAAESREFSLSESGLPSASAVSCEVSKFAAVKALGVFLPLLVRSYALLGWWPVAVLFVKFAATLAPFNGDFKPAHIPTLQVFHSVLSFFFLIKLDEAIGALDSINNF